MAAPAAPFRAFASVWACYFAAIGLFNPYAPLWFKDLGFSTLAIGGIISMQAWTRVVTPYAWGWLGDRRGERVAFIRVAAFGSVLAAAGLLFVRDYAAVSLFTVLLFVANGGVVPLSEAALGAHLARGGEMDTARYGRVRVWGSVGFIAAVVLAGVLLQRAGIGWFPWLVAGMFGALLLASFALPGQRDPVAGHAALPGIAAVLRRPEVAWFFASVFFTVLAHTSLYGFFSLYLDSLGYSKAAVGALWAVSIVCEIAFFWWQGPLFGRLSPLAWLRWAAALAVLRFALTAAFGGSIAVLVVAQVLHVVTFAAQHAACIVLITRHFPGPLRGRGQALYATLGYGISGVVGGLGGGVLSDRWGLAAVFWAGAAAAAVGYACARVAGREPALRPA